ncbi:hypothetical protein JZU68_09980, partial [bacterium]|nr:hypothetical protein [bacterium]
KQKLTVNDISKPFKTIAGILKLSQGKDFDEKLSYKIIDYPLVTITNNLSRSIQINTINKKTNAVKISLVSSNTAKAQAIINKLVELYNLDAVLDKNIIASNT